MNAFQTGTDASTACFVRRTGTPARAAVLVVFAEIDTLSVAGHASSLARHPSRTHAMGTSPLGNAYCIATTTVRRVVVGVHALCAASHGPTETRKAARSVDAELAGQACVSATATVRRVVREVHARSRAFGGAPAARNRALSARANLPRLACRAATSAMTRVPIHVHALASAARSTTCAIRHTRPGRAHAAWSTCLSTRPAVCSVDASIDALPVAPLLPERAARRVLTDAAIRTRVARFGEGRAIAGRTQ